MNTKKWLNKNLRKQKISVTTLSEVTSIDVDTLLYYSKGQKQMSQEHQAIIESAFNEPIYQENIIVKNYTPKGLIGALSVKKIVGKRRLIIQDFKYAFSTIIKDYRSVLKMVLMLLLGTFVLAYLVDQFATENLLYSAIVPITLLTIIYLSTKAETFSVVDMFKFVLIGGLASIFVVITVREFTGYPGGLFGDFLTAFIEETAKILLVIALLKKFKIITVKAGVLVGFAVGAGFDLFETADYGFMVFLDMLDYTELYGVITARNVYAIFGIGHHFWTAVLAGVLVYIKKTEKLHVKQLLNPIFIQAFIVVVTLHALWNFSASIDSIISYVLMLTVMILSTWIFLKLFQVAHYEELFNQHMIAIKLKENVQIDSNEISLNEEETT